MLLPGSLPIMRGAEVAARQRVFLHIGPPKTGTTYLQSVLWDNKARLAQAGVTLPGSGPAPHFAAAADLRGRADRAGAWDAMAKEVRAAPGVSVVSCEWLAFCTPEQVQRAVTSFGDVEVHVAVTLRDLGRVVPAVWQEQIKNGRKFTMTEFLTQLENPGAHSYGAGFWSVQDTRQLLGRWGEHLPSDRMHVVTLPRPGASPDELWLRFGSLFLDDDAPPASFDTSRVKANAGLDPAEAEMLRRVNAELDGRLPKAAHAPLVKDLLHESLTASDRSGSRVRLPAEAVTMIATRADEIGQWLRSSGFHVVGDLDDLTVAPASGQTSLPEESPEDAVAKAAVRAMTTLLLTMQADGAHRRRVWRRDPAKTAAKANAKAKAKATLTAKAPHRVVQLARRAADRARRAVRA
jgi:hypothetical protein